VRADRLVSLVLLLQARGRMTARGLAGELGVSVRTIYRDLAGLSTAGVPVIAEPGPGGGCWLLDGYRFPLRALSQEEAEALLMLGAPGIASELGLDRVLAAAHRQIRVTAGMDGHRDMPGWFRSREHVPHLRTLAEALRQRRGLELRYRREATSADRVPRVVTPLGLVNKAGTWYLVAMPGSGLRDKATVFRAGRITGARVLAAPASRPAGFDLREFWEAWSREFAASRPRLLVRLRASPHALAVFPEVFGNEIRGAISKALAPDGDGWQEISLSFEHELAAAQRLAGFGGQVRVLSPAAVRGRILAAAHGILSQYGVPIPDEPTPHSRGL
jgi:predicted DNA-binding transcriptional regulator YafY